MRRSAAILGIVAAAIVLAVVWQRASGPPAASTPSPTPTSDSARERTLRFWELYREATRHRIGGRPDSAIRLYTEALALNDRHEDALYYLGNMYFDLGQFPAAATTWGRLLDVDSNSARAHSRLGALYACFEDTTLFDLAAAAAAFRRASEINPEETGPLLDLGKVALMGGDLDQAVAHFDAVLGSNVRSVESHFLKGYIAWKRGRRTDAARLFGEAIEYARPQAPAGGVAGEGDTRAGERPMLASETRCRPFAALVADLPAIEAASLSAELETRYRALDALLSEARRHAGS